MTANGYLQWSLLGLSSESREPQEGKEVMVKCKEDTCTDSGAVPTTPRGVQPPSKEDKNLKEEAVLQTS